MPFTADFVFPARDRDLGGFRVRRALPYPGHRMVGPFIFWDHMGPMELIGDHNMDVRPHPHIGLATVTYLFAGKIFHRDSLGSQQVIEPGAINWMTAGKGIVHSERTPEELRHETKSIHGIQCWVALPEDKEDMEPAFSHHPAKSIPEFDCQGCRFRLLLGSAFGKASPVPVHSDIFYLEGKMNAGSRVEFNGRDRESAIYVVSGDAFIDGVKIPEGSMGIVPNNENFTVEANSPVHALFLGGAPVGPRHIFWNLVSSSKEKLEAAKTDWAKGPRKDSARFQPIPGDDSEFIPLPVNT